MIIEVNSSYICRFTLSRDKNVSMHILSLALHRKLSFCHWNFRTTIFTSDFDMAVEVYWSNSNHFLGIFDIS